MSTTTKQEFHAHELLQFTGTDNYYRHWLMKRLIYTDGIKYLAERAGAYWLIDLIASHQPAIRKCERPEFQSWKLVRNESGNGCKITCDDGDGLIMAEQDVEYTDFPLREFGCFCIDDGERLVLCLTSEY
jgi:hypothetical protein